MPSPFPGMDPYLEDPALWPGFHTRLINEIAALLVPQVTPRYFVDIEKRLYVLPADDPAGRQIVPDVAILRGSGRETATSFGEFSQPVVLTMQDEMEMAEARLVIAPREGGAAVTILEVLSPTNKTAGSQGRRDYLEKRGEIVHSSTHLVEIDLLRVGERFPTLLQRLPLADYYVHVSREAQRPRGEVWPIRLRSPLPTVPVPLRAGDAEVRLDLGEAVKQAYDRGGYGARIDYAQPPAPPLGEADAAWWKNRAEK